MHVPGIKIQDLAITASFCRLTWVTVAENSFAFRGLSMNWKQVTLGS